MRTRAAPSPDSQLSFGISLAMRSHFLGELSYWRRTRASDPAMFAVSLMVDHDTTLDAFPSKLSVTICATQYFSLPIASISWQDTLQKHMIALLRENEVIAAALSHCEGRALVALPPSLAQRAILLEDTRDRGTMIASDSDRIQISSPVHTPQGSPHAPRRHIDVSPTKSFRLVAPSSERSNSMQSSSQHSGDADIGIGVALGLLEDQLMRASAVLAVENVCTMDLLSSIVWHPVRLSDHVLML
jgi:hypothetical protein